MTFEDKQPIVQTVLYDKSGSYYADVASDGRLKTNTTGSVALSEAVPQGENVLGFVRLTDASGSAPTRVVDLVYDTAEQIYRMAVTAKVTISSPEAPPDTTEVQVVADDPLSVTTTEDTTYTITSGTIFHVQQVVAGAAGDPNEKGSKAEIYYSSSDGEHLIERIYILGETQFGSYPDTSLARDGTALSGSANPDYIVIRRTRLGGAAQEVDVVLRGFER